MERMQSTNKSTILSSLLLIALLIPVNISQQTVNNTLQTFTIPNSKYILLVTESAFNWYDAREYCINSGYEMSQINTTAQNNEIQSLMASTQQSIQSCWLGAFGIFSQASNNTIEIDWHWDYLRHLQWNSSFANRYMQPPKSDIDPRKMQGLTIRIKNNDPVWSYINADIESQQGSQQGSTTRRCVVCLDAANVLTDQPTLSPTPIPTISPTFQPSINPSIAPSNQPSISPSNQPSISPSRYPSLLPTISPSNNPSITPTFNPSIAPTLIPTIRPTPSPSIKPSVNPTNIPTINPTYVPTFNPSITPTKYPTFMPTITPTNYPSNNPTSVPTISPTTWRPTEVNETRPPTPYPTESPTDIPTETPTNYPTFNPSLLPTPFPTPIQSHFISTPYPTRDWTHIGDHIGEIRLDVRANQSCEWESMTCGHCLEILRISIMEEYNQQNDNTYNELLPQHSDYDHCNCLGGKGEPTLNHQLIISLTNNITTFTFKPNTIDNDPDDIMLHISNWVYYNNNSIEHDIKSTSCQLEFYVNRNTFLGITARNVLSIEFYVTNIDNVENIRNNYNLQDLLMQYFSNLSLLIDEITDIKAFVIDGANDDINVRRLQSSIWEDDDISVQIFVYTHSAETARFAKIDMEQSQLLPHGWHENLRLIIGNKTGEINCELENIHYDLLTPIQVPQQVAEIEDPDPAEALVKLAFWLVVLIAMGVIIFSVVIITTVVYCYCKGKKSDSMIYQKPEVTHDHAISEYNESEFDECDEEEGELEAGHISGFDVKPDLDRLLPIGKSTKIVSDVNPQREMHNTNMPNFPLDKYPFPKPDGGAGLSHTGGLSRDSGDNGSSQVSNMDSDDHDVAETISTFSVHTTTAWHFDMDSNLSTDEYVQNIITKVCSNNKTQLISHNELEIDYMIGKGHFGRVYAGKYDGNKVAVKEFPELCINGRNGSYNSERNGSYNNFGKLRKGGYSSLSNEENYEEEEEELKAFRIDTNFDINVEMKNKEAAKKRNAKEKEIYSEVVLASSLPIHPNLVEIIGITSKPLKIVMTFYEGGNLEQFIYKCKKNNKLTLHSVLILMQKIAEGVLFLHNNKIVHRDIAARNILLGRIGNDKQVYDNTTIVVSDFGMTRLMGNDMHLNNNNRDNSCSYSMSYSRSFQKTNTKIGPIKWMAPESIVKRQYSYKSDVYMFGVTMFEIMNKFEPYNNMKYKNLTIPMLSKKIVKDNMRPVIDLEYLLNEFSLDPIKHKSAIPKINKLIESCWNKEIDKRPSMLNIISTLNSIQDHMLGLKY